MSIVVLRLICRLCLLLVLVVGACGEPDVVKSVGGDTNHPKFWFNGDAGVLPDSAPDPGPDPAPDPGPAPAPDPGPAPAPDPGPAPAPDPGPDPDPPPAPDPNAGWIGGSCDSNGDCAFENGKCLTETQGYPGGMCTTPCTKYCPDKAGHPITFCIDGADLGWTQPQCVARCNFNVYKWGCKTGYHCEARSRAKNQGALEYVCLPGSGPKIFGTTCYQELADLGVMFHPKVDKKSKAGSTNYVCSIPDALSLSGTIDGIYFRYSSFTAEPKSMYGSCRLGHALYKSVQLLHEMNVTDIVHYGTYNCRLISGTNKLSEHGLGTAIDFAAFKTVTGAEYWVDKDWELNSPDPIVAGAKMLWDFATTLFYDKIFHIILTPDYDHCTSKGHDNHFHVDLTIGSHFLSMPNSCN